MVNYTDMDDQRRLIASEGTQWLLNLGLIDNPFMKNALIFNILKVSNRIKNTELFIDTTNKKMLIYLEIDWWARLTRQKRSLAEEVFEMLSEALPGYEFRVVYNKAILEKAIERFSQQPGTMEVSNAEINISTDSDN